MNDSDIWGSRPDSGHEKGVDLAGYAVQATDGRIGKLDKYSDEVGASHAVVDTGVRIFGRQVLLLAGIIERVDTAEEKVYVNRTREQIRKALAFDLAEQDSRPPTCLEQFARYYNQPHR